MGFDFLDFLGGVAEGASKTLEQQIQAQKEAIKESSSFKLIQYRGCSILNETSKIRTRQHN